MNLFYFHANSLHDAGDSGGGTGRGCEHIGCPACVNLGAI